MSYGSKISELRRQNNMTQADLGATLNVTYQAVSKWERDESDPDFATMVKLAKLFGVPLSYFSNEEDEQEVAAGNAAEAPSTQAIAEEVMRQMQEAKEQEERKRLEEEEQKRLQQLEEAKQKARRAKELEKYSAHRRRNIGLIVGGIVAGAAAIAGLVGMILDGVSAGTTAVLVAIILVFGFTFVSQLFWNGFIVDWVLWGFKIIGTPGVIFTLDLDGFIFLIVVKILFAVLKIIVLILLMLLSTFTAILISPIAFVIQVIQLSRGHEL